jgi:hypothetical protein
MILHQVARSTQLTPVNPVALVPPRSRALRELLCAGVFFNYYYYYYHYCYNY